MTAIKLSREWFSPKGEDGNLSLATRESRIREAVASMNPGDWIELEDGTKCTSAAEVKKALGISENQSGGVKAVICPNCGANTTNHYNCDYCGSFLVQRVSEGMDMTKYHNIAMRYKNDGLLRVIRDYVSMVKSDPDTENDVWVESKTEHLVVVGNNRTDEIARLWGHDGIHVGITFFDDVDAEHRYSRFKMSNVASVFKPYTIDGKACSNADELPVDELQFYADFGYDAEGACQVALQILSDIYEDRIEDLVYEVHNPQDDKIRIEAKQAEWRQSPEGKKEKRKDILTIAALVVGVILYIIIRSII